MFHPVGITIMKAIDKHECVSVKRVVYYNNHYHLTKHDGLLKH